MGTLEAAAKPAMSSRVASSLNPVFRKGILAATHNGVVRRGVSRYGMRLGAARFVAGETLDECVPVLRGLNQKGLRTNTTLLGEGVKDEAMEFSRKGAARPIVASDAAQSTAA